jgi:hypothetical protein
MDAVTGDHVADQGTISPEIQGRITGEGEGCPTVAPTQ